MRVWQVSGSVRLALVVALVGGWGIALVSPAWAQELRESDEFLVLRDELNAQPDHSVVELPVPLTLQAGCDDAGLPSLCRPSPRPWKPPFSSA